MVNDRREEVSLVFQPALVMEQGPAYDWLSSERNDWAGHSVTQNCKKDFAPSEAYALGQSLWPLAEAEAEARMKAGNKPSGNLPESQTRYPPFL
jgi:hypothetical protein